MKCEWYFKFDAEKYVDAVARSKFLRNNVRLWLIAFYATLGSDITSYFYQTQKVRTFKKDLGDKAKIRLLRSFGKDKEFIWSVNNAGKVNETYIKTRHRLNKSLKSKFSMSLPLYLLLSLLKEPNLKHMCGSMDMAHPRWRRHSCLLWWEPIFSSVEKRQPKKPRNGIIADNKDINVDRGQQPTKISRQQMASN